MSLERMKIWDATPDTQLGRIIRPYLSEIKSLSSYSTSIPFILLASYLFYNFVNTDTVIALGKEDSLFEWLTSLFYFISSILLFLTLKKNRNIFLLLLGMVLLFGAGEEISWGQRIFGFATPERIREINMQQEFNIHNLVVFSGKTPDGHAQHGLQRFLYMDFLFKLFTVCFGIVLPFCVYHFKFISDLTKKLKVPVPPISVGIFFAISWIGLKFSLLSIPLEANMEHYWRVFMAGPEIAEFIGSYIMFMICLYFYNYRKMNIMGKDFKQL